jgi:hypothetical protein
MLLFLSTYVLAMASTRVFGGTSETNRVARFCAM